MSAPSRPMLRWLGGKYRLAHKIVALMPPHRIYVEPFGGAASVLLAKPRAYNEVLNDLDGELVNLYRVLRRPDLARALIARLRLTPYAEAEYRLALEPSDEPIERAARLIIRSHMGHGSNAAQASRATGFRSDGRSGSTNVAGEWAALARTMRQITRRLRGVTLRQEPAGRLIDLYRDPKVLIYLDPPYLPDTRSGKQKGGEPYHAYAHEMTLAEHRDMLAQLADHPAMIILSGYPSDLYDSALQGWEVREFEARAHRNAPRREVLWINPAAQAALAHGPLFGPPTCPPKDQQRGLREADQQLQIAGCDDSAGPVGEPQPPTESRA